MARGSLPAIPDTMMATLFRRSKDLAPIIERVETPKIKFPHDAIVRVCKTTICGTDLHLLRGAVSTIQDRTIMGHEGIGESCGWENKLVNSRWGIALSSHALQGVASASSVHRNFMVTVRMVGGFLGHLIDGMQAEYRRVPHVDASCYFVPRGVKDTPEEEKYVMISDILPTALEIGLLDGKVRDGMTIGIVGVGPVGLAAVIAASSFFRPAQIVAVDLDNYRLSVAKTMGATDVINNKNGDAVEQIMDLTDGKGLDLVVEAIGVPAGWYICQRSVKSGGHIAILGVHGEPATLNLETMWYRNFTMTAGMVHCYTMDDLMQKISEGELDASKLISHHFKLSDIALAYQTFAHASDTQCLGNTIK